MISLHSRYKAILALLAIPQLVSAQAVDPKSHQQFADNLTSLLYTNSNECSSALGVSMAFSLLYPGSTNEGISQIRDSFNYPSNNLQLGWQDTTQQLQSSASGKCISEFNGVCNSYAPTIQIANSIWIHNQCDDSGLFCLHTLNSTYDNVVGEYAIQTDFEADESPVIVNEWVSNSTNGLITSIVDESKPLFPPYVLIAINSIYLKARWLDQFSDYTTTLDTFYNSPSRDKKQSEAHFMHTLNYYDYSHSVLNGYQIIKLPFAETSSLTMIFVLPQDEELEEVTSTELITSLDSLVNIRIALALPKFKFESTYDDNLKESLMQLGVVSPFTGNALCGIFDTKTYNNCESLIIDKVIQKTVIDVNEKGVEAAAVTAAMATPTSMGPPITDVPIKMILDHPFQFFIYDSDEELVLFEGRLGEPELPEDEPEVQLFDGEHSSTDFWSSTFGVDPIDPPDYVETVETEDVEEVENTTSTADPIIVCPDGRESIPDTFCGRGPNRADCVEGQFCHIHPTDIFAVCCLNPVDDGESTAPLASEVQTLTSDEATNSTTELVPMDAAGQQAFADELTPLIYTNENDCFSALGVSMALSLVYPGSKGDGIEQLRDTLRYPNGTNMRLIWEDTTTRMLNNSDGECLWESMGECASSKPLLQIANSVWFDDGDILNAEYDAVVGEYAMQTDFEAAESPIIVNDWVENSTNGLIDSIVDESKPLFPPFVLLATNSIYLKATWLEQFEKRSTNLDSFYDSASKSVEVGKAHFMNNVDYFGYSHDALPGYQVIDLPFDNSQMSMIFVLPKADGAESVTSTDVISASSSLQNTRVALSLPKFKFESKYEDELKDALFQLGIVAPFTEGSGALCGIFEDTEGCENLIIDKVIQKTVIDVNEEGVEAAAVTMVGVSLTSVGPPPEDPVLMTLNHPFQFFIYDKDEELTLFEGRVGNPGLPEDEPQVELLDASHSDSDFWPDNFYVDPVNPPVSEDTTTVSTVTNEVVAQTEPQSEVSSTPAPQPTTDTSSTNLPIFPTTSSPTDQPVETSGAGNDKSSKTFASICTSIFLVYALALV